MSNDPVPVFISYHKTDYVIAHQLEKSLHDLSKDFEVFLDKTSIEPGDDYRVVIADALARAHWLLIVCTGFPRPDVDMSWSFFEAGQFSATLPSVLKPFAHKRMVCLFDKEPPSILAPLQGVRVSNRQKIGALIDLQMPDPRLNTQIDETFIFDLFASMLNNRPMRPLRDVNEASVKQDIREQSEKIINLFESASGAVPIDEYALHPRLSYDIELGGSLTNETPVKGYNDSLGTLFSISKSECTWGDIVESCNSENNPRPMWLHDVEAAARAISNERRPKATATKCFLNDEIYRVFTSRYEIFKTRKRTVYIGFIPAAARNFDLNKNSGILLSSLILSVRFREQIIPASERLEHCKANDDARKELIDFSRQLQSVEMEALQFGLYAHEESPEDSLVAGAVRNTERRNLIESGLRKWNTDRKVIAAMFSDKDDLFGDALGTAKVLAQILKEIEPVNTNFIAALCEELYRQSDKPDF